MDRFSLRNFKNSMASEVRHCSWNKYSAAICVTVEFSRLVGKTIPLFGTTEV